VQGTIAEYRYDKTFNVFQNETGTARVKVFQCIVKYSYCIMQIEWLCRINENGCSMKIRSDARQLTVGQFANECSIHVKLNANGPVKYIKWYK